MRFDVKNTQDTEPSPVLCYSVESYAYNMRNDSSVPYLAELVERMMCYGDSARAYVESIS